MDQKSIGLIILLRPLFYTIDTRNQETDEIGERYRLNHAIVTKLLFQAAIYYL